MPTVRYEIRNEFGLGSTKLYGAVASKDDPEALLEGVAMAGLVGILRQLGDLAEFASEIFHDLHKEVMATATRGHGLMLRVQQVEAEFPSTEKAFLCQSSQTHFAYNMGSNWHSKLQVDQNLLTREGIPKFIIDSYEECHSPPQFSMLDKYDVAGAGACLKRYSDPSYFRMELASSGIVQSQVGTETIVHKHKKKGPRSSGESPGIFSASHFSSKLQFMASNQASEELPVTHVKLKSRHMNGSETTSYMEHLRQVLSPEENCVPKNSESYLPFEMKPIASSESVSEVHGISFGSSADIERNPRQSDVADLVIGMESQRIKVEELPQTLPKHEKSTEGSADGCSTNKLKINSSGLPETDQKEFSSDDDWRTEGSSGGYSSDDTSSNVDNYTDARNTMESEVDTDCENNVKPNLSFTTTTQKMNSSADDELELQAQNSRQDSPEISSSVRRRTSCKIDSSPTPYSCTSSERSDAQPPHMKRISLDVLANSDMYTDETHDKIPDQQRNCEDEVDSLENSRSTGKCSAKASPISSMSEYAEELYNYSTTESTSLLKHFSNGHPANSQSAVGGLKGMSLGFVDTTHGVVKDLESKLPCKLEKSTISSLTKNDQLFRASNQGSDTFSDISSHVISQPILLRESSLENMDLEDHAEGLVSKDASVTSGKLDHLSGRQDGRMIEVPSGLVEESLPSSNIPTGHSQESTKQVAEASQGGIRTPHILTFSPSNSSTSMLIQGRSEEIEDLGTPEKSAPISLKGTHEVCTPHVALSLVEAQLGSAPIFSNSEMHIPDLSYPSDTKLSNDDCQAIPSKHARNGSHPNNTEDCIDPHGIEKDSDSEASTDQQTGSIPIIITFERYLSLKKNDGQSDPIDTMGKLSDSTCEPDSHDTANNVSFTDFLKLTQMDWLLNSTKEIPVDPLEKSFGSEVTLQISQNAKDDSSLSSHFITRNTNPFEEASEVQVASENMISSEHGDELLRPSDFPSRSCQFAGQENDAGNSMVGVQKLPQLESVLESYLIFSNCMDSPPSNVFRYAQQIPYSSIPSDCIYQLHECSLPSNSSNFESLISPGNSESTLQRSSGQQSCEPVSVCPVVDNAFQETVEELPPLPPLPPLEWRMGKLQMGHLTSHLKLAQSSIGRNLFTALSAIDEKPSHDLSTEGGTTIEKSNLFAASLGSEEEMPKCSSICFERDSMQSMNLSHMHQTGMLPSEEPAADTLDLSSVQSPIEDDNHLYDLQEFSKEKVHPLNPFLSSDDKISEHSVSVPIPPWENERSQLDQLLLSSEKEKEPTSVVSFQESECHQPEYKTPESTAVEDYAISPDDLTIQMLDDEKPKKKLSLLHRPRDPLIEDVASLDKSTLRKVTEPAQPSTKSKTGESESSTLLEQIRKKSHNLKPTSGVKPNLRGPPTNLKIAAILEKANAIRQACVGSDDDDDDGDSWSDS